jgi:predicted dehydrogenase
MAVKVGLIGAGGMGNVHASQYAKMPDVSVVVFDGAAERSAPLAERVGGTVVDSLEKLLETVDVVDICLPTDIHAEFGLRAMEAKRPIFMEKPVCRTWEQAVGLAEAAAKHGVTVMPGQVVRFFPEFRTGHQLVKNGAVGTPAAARTRRGGGAPGGSRGWFMDHARSGGILLDLAIHDFDWLRWTFGEVKFLESRSVAAKTKTGPDYALTTLTFESGLVAHVESTWMDPSGFRVSYEVAGKDGLIAYDSSEHSALKISNRAEKTTGSYLAVNENPLSPTDDPYYLELKAFLDAVRDGTPPPVTLEDGIQALAISLAAMESTETGKRTRPLRI